MDDKINNIEEESITISSNEIHEQIDYINNNNIRSIYINDTGYKSNEIDFLKLCPNVEKVNIYSYQITNFSGLYNLEKLKVLYLDEAKGEIDLSRFKKLEEFRGVHNKYILGLGECKSLKIVSLSKYKPKNKDLDELTNLENIEFLELIQGQITSLKGVGSLKKLTKLEFNRIYKLEIIDELEKNNESLKILKFECCKKIKNHNYVTLLKNLEILSFNNCGDIPSVGFIKELPKLRQFIFVDTNVVDGDLSPCVGLEYSGFFDKKHYSHKFKELNDKKYWK
ncbi:MAG: hypothetical protein Q8936_21075 [Bacillota bacterium]|nr:hypothetical protein [Bacillota bacterium]